MSGRCSIKWFKHDTDCDRSEGLSYLLEKEGFAGYGRWFRLLEIVASRMDQTDLCHAEYTSSRWAALLGLKQKKLKTFLEHCENKLRTKVVYSENIIRIEIPNLLKKRDDYSRKSVHTPKKVHLDVEVEVEVEVEESKTILLEPLSHTKETSTKETSKEKDDPFKDVLEWFWLNYPHRHGIKTGKKPADENLRKYVKTGELEDFKRSVDNFKSSPTVKDGIGIPDPERFIYSAKKKCEPWRDWIRIERISSRVSAEDQGNPQMAMIRKAQKDMEKERLAK